MGNLTNITYPMTTDVAMAYNGLNRLTNAVAGVGTYQYRYTGNLLTFVDGPFSDDAMVYTHNGTGLRWPRPAA